MKKKRRRKLGTLGFTFVELMIAVAILGVCVAPIMSTFVVSSRMNMKGRQKEQAQTIAQNIVEGVKAFGIKNTVKVCQASNTGSFTLIPENLEGSTKIGHSVTKSVLSTSTISVAGYEYWIDTTFPAGETVTTKSGEYEIKLENILMGATYYDATITIIPDYTQEKVAAYVFEETFEQAGMSNLKYYDVVATVYLHDGTEQLAYYTGTFVDQD